MSCCPVKLCLPWKTRYINCSSLDLASCIKSEYLINKKKSVVYLELSYSTVTNLDMQWERSNQKYIYKVSREDYSFHLTKRVGSILMPTESDCKIPQTQTHL